MAQILSVNKPLKEVKAGWTHKPAIGQTCCFFDKESGRVTQTGVVVDIYITHNTTPFFTKFETENSVYEIVADTVLGG